MVPAVSGGGPRAPPYSGSPPRAARLRLRASHPLRGGLPAASAPPAARSRGPYYPGGARRPPRFGRPPLSLAATRGTTVVSSSSGYWDVSVRRVRAPSRGRPAFSRAGCPIRTPRGHRPCAPRPGFSQLSASFIASGSLGIRRAPCLRFPRARAARPRPHGRAAGRARASALSFPLLPPLPSSSAWRRRPLGGAGAPAAPCQ